MNTKISAVIIARDEEPNIGRALESLKWADEIIVLDTGSEDRTVEICRDSGARVEETTWSGYVEAKNQVAGMASCDWVLSLDADEEITPQLTQEIKEIVNGSKENAGYRIPRNNHYLGKRIRYCGWYPDLQLRLWKRGKGKWVGGRVHERVEVEGQVGETSSAMNHYTYGSIKEHIGTMEKYAGLQARDKFEAGKRTSAVSLFFTPPWQFFRLYILRLGFLDGASGLIVSAMGAFYAFLKKARLWELQNSKSE